METSPMDYVEMDRLFEMFMQEKQYLENCTPCHLKFLRTCYRAFKLAEVKELGKPGLVHFIKNMLGRGLSARTCNDYLKGMRVFLKWLQANEHVKELPVIRSIREEKKIHPSFADQVLQKIIDANPKGMGLIRVRIIMLVLMDTGCRIAEALSLRRENVDFDNLHIKVMGKGRRERLQPIGPELRTELRKYLLTHRSEYVFPTEEGKPLDPRNVWRDAGIFFGRIGVKFKGFHCFRRTFARNYLKQGGDLARLVFAMGHADISTTMLYLAPDVDDLKRMHQKTSILGRLKRNGAKPRASAVTPLKRAEAQPVKDSSGKDSPDNDSADKDSLAS